MNQRQVIFHIPSHGWKPGVSPLEQTGVMDHLAYLQSLMDAGKVVMGGPFLDETAGGMLVLEDSVTPDEAVQIADADPAVVSGLIRYEMRPWYVTLEK